MQPSAQKQLIVGFVATYVVVFLLMAALGYYYAPKSSAPARMGRQESVVVLPDTTYYQMPTIAVSTIDAFSQNANNHRIFVDIQLEVDRKDLPRVQGFEPRIAEQVGRMFSTLSPETLLNAKNIGWLRLETLRTVNQSTESVPVHDVVFRQMVMM